MPAMASGHSAQTMQKGMANNREIPTPYQRERTALSGFRAPMFCAVMVAMEACSDMGIIRQKLVTEPMTLEAAETYRPIVLIMAPLIMKLTLFMVLCREMGMPTFRMVSMVSFSGTQSRREKGNVRPFRRMYSRERMKQIPWDVTVEMAAPVAAMCHTPTVT